MEEAQKENERARAEHLARLALRRDAYVHLFGTQTEPTPMGQRVLEDLERFCTTHEESLHLDRTGRVDPYATIYRDGKKAVAQRIREMISWTPEQGNIDEHSISSTVPATSQPAAAGGTTPEHG